MEKLLTLEEAIKYFGVNSKEAIYNRARIGKSLQRVEKDGEIFYKVLVEKKTNISKQKKDNISSVSNNISISEEVSDLKLEVAQLKAKLEGKEELIQELRNSKEEIILAKNLQIEEKNKQLDILGGAYNELKNIMKFLQEPQSKEDNKPQTPKTEKPQEQEQEPQHSKPQELKIELAEMLLKNGLNETERKRVKARFNKRVGTRGITKEQSKIYISKTENYEDLLKV